MVAFILVDILILIGVLCKIMTEKFRNIIICIFIFNIFEQLLLYKNTANFFEFQNLYDNILY
jgi:hypothetical protein